MASCAKLTGMTGIQMHRHCLKTFSQALGEKEKTIVSKLIDAFLFQEEMKQKLAQ
jgi:hypothetical protein